MVVLDQITKISAVAALSDGPVRLLGDTLALRLARNPGAAFSSFQTGGAVLAVVAAAMVVIIILALPGAERRGEAIALGLVLGGAAGNLLDRIFRADGFLDGAVVDFIDFSFWPSFNVADSGITLGVVGLLLMTMTAKRAHEPV